MPIARTRFNVEQTVELVEAYREFVRTNEYPIPAAFIARNPVALKYHLTKRELENLPMFREILEWSTAKEEAYLVETMTLSPGKAIPSLFLLKQSKHGYTDRVTTDITSNGEKIKFSSLVPRPSTRRIVKNKRPPLLIGKIIKP